MLHLLRDMPPQAFRDFYIFNTFVLKISGRPLGSPQSPFFGSV